jgi:hypothetical protein
MLRAISNWVPVSARPAIAAGSTRGAAGQFKSEIRNPKSEVRVASDRTDAFRASGFGFDSDFGFRISDLRILLLLPFLAISFPLVAAEETLEINPVGFSAGGGLSGDAFFSLDGTFGSPVADVASDDVFTLEAGFWPASLTAPPAVTQQPESLAVNLGAPVLFEIGTAGDPPLKYQWRLNGVDIPEATNASFFISSAQLTNGGSYTVVVFNDKGSTLSKPFNLGFTLVRTPPQNIFANRAVIATTNVLFIGDNTNATRESGEMRHAGKPGGHSVWYKWTAPDTGIATFQTTGSAFDTLLAVYTGNQVSQLTPVVANDDVRGRFLASEVRFNAVKDVEYQIALDGLGGAEGEFVISWSLENTSDVLPVFSQSLVGRTVPEGGSTVFTANAVGAGLTYQWYFNQARIPGALLSSLSVPNVSISDIGSYFVAVTNGLGRGAHSDEASLEIGSANSPVSYAKFAEAVGEANAEIGAAGGGGGGMPFFKPAAAVPSPVGFETVSVGTIDNRTMNNSNAIANGCAACGGAVGGAMQTYVLQPLTDGVLTIDTVGSSFDTLLYVYRNAPLSEICSFLVTCDNNSAPDGSRSVVSFPAQAGVRYLIAVDGVNGARGTIVLNWKLCLAPAPFEMSDAGFTLKTPANPGVYPDQPNYHWFQNAQEIGTTTEPFFALAQSPAETANFSVRYAMVDHGAFHQVTNVLGLFLNMSTSLTSTSPPIERIVLPGLTSPMFRVEAAMTTMTNCDGRWLWLPVTNYTVTTQQTSVVLTFPASSTNRMHRIRPVP